MCLYASQDQTERLRKQISERKFSKRYGIARDGTLVAPLQLMRVQVSEDGLIISNRNSAELSKLEKLTGQVERGIHCFSDLSPYHNNAEAGEIIVDLIVDEADFVACDGMMSQCVFHKVRVDPVALKTAMDNELTRRKEQNILVGTVSYGDPISSEIADQREEANYVRALEEEEDCDEDDDWDDEDEDDDWDDEDDDWDDDDDDDDWDDDDDYDDEE